MKTKQHVCVHIFTFPFLSTSNSHSLHHIFIKMCCSAFLSISDIKTETGNSGISSREQCRLSPLNIFFLLFSVLVVKHPFTFVSLIYAGAKMKMTEKVERKKNEPILYDVNIKHKTHSIAHTSTQEGHSADK